MNQTSKPSKIRTEVEMLLQAIIPALTMSQINLFLISG